MGQQAALAVGGIDTFQKGLFVVSGRLVHEGTEGRVIAHNLKNFAGHGGCEINKLTVFDLRPFAVRTGQAQDTGVAPRLANRAKDLDFFASHNVITCRCRR